MVRGIESFREWFRGHEEQYAIIGGTACDLLMTDGGLDFRATKDIDLVGRDLDKAYPEVDFLTKRICCNPLRMFMQRKRRSS